MAAPATDQTSTVCGNNDSRPAGVRSLGTADAGSMTGRNDHAHNEPGVEVGLVPPGQTVTSALYPGSGNRRVPTCATATSLTDPRREVVRAAGAKLSGAELRRLATAMGGLSPPRYMPTPRSDRALGAVRGICRGAWRRAAYATARSRACRGSFVARPTGSSPVMPYLSR